MPKRPFYDRRDELARMRQVLRSARPELIIVSGRRGAGKSYLLDHAFAERKYFSYTATDRLLPLQLADIATTLNDLQPGLVRGTLASTDQVLELFATLAARDRRSPLVVVIDELPYLAKRDTGLLTALQRWFNAQKKAGARNLKVFLAGSQVSWMEEQALAESAPLKSVRTGDLRLDQLSYRAAASFYPRFSAEDRVRAWAVWGGLPGYLEQLDPRRAFWANLEQSTLVRGSRLFDEPDWLKYTELRSAPIYTSIVRMVASGRVRPSTIAKGVGRDSANDVSTYLDSLREASVLDRVAPLLRGGAGPTQAARYVVADNFLSYWYRFVDPHRTALERGIRALLLATMRGGSALGLDKYVSERPFEQVCREFLYEALRAGRLPADLRFERVGSWWSTREDERADESDIVAYAADALVAIGECKWTKGVLDERDLAGLDRVLREAAAPLNPAANVYRLLFARSGFSPKLRRRAADRSERLLLFEPNDLYW